MEAAGRAQDWVAMGQLFTNFEGAWPPREPAKSLPSKLGAMPSRDVNPTAPVASANTALSATAGCGGA